MAEIRGILFDLGDTLLDFEQLDTIELFEQGARKTYDYLQSLGRPLPSFAKYHRRQLRAVRWAYFKSFLTRREFNAADLLARIAQGGGRSLSEEQIETLSWLWYEPLSRQATVEPGLADMLRALADKGLTLAIVSNTFIPPNVLDRHLQREGLLELFPTRVYSSETRFRKPHRRIFRIALELVDLPPTRVMFVGDSLRNDIRGANRAGMVTVLKDPAGRNHSGRIRPNYTVKSLSELPSIIEHHNA